MSGTNSSWVHRIEISALITLVGIIFLFSFSIAVVLVAPSYVDPTWTQPSSAYQVQMYEISDPNLYIGSSAKGGKTLQFVYHLKNNYSLLAFQESESVRIKAPEELQKYVTRHGEKILKLTSRLLLLRPPKNISAADTQSYWELYEPTEKEAFAVAPVDGIVENWVDQDFSILDDTSMQTYHKDFGVIYVSNPKEYRITKYNFGDLEEWRYDPQGKPIKNLADLQSHPLGFRSRAELIALGEHIYAIEGCWYCHTDQTRTLIQDVVLNGSADFPAPPSSANEYIYQKITFPGTRRIGPDLSRTGIKRPSRDWHKGHFWSPKTASKGSIMPAFHHFFDDDPRGTEKLSTGIPNYKFEAIFQYLMTKGTRITPPTQAWWLGKDPVDTKAIIEGRKK